MNVTGLSIDNIFVGYGRRQVIEGLHLHVDQGEVIGLIGPNGSGKSTLLRAIAGILFPHKGTIVWRGNLITHVPTSERIGMGIGCVPQRDNVFRELTVAENLEIGGLVSTLEKRRMRHEFLLHLFPALPRLMPRIAGTLSGGERQLVAICRALMADPELLLMDEPTAGLHQDVKQDFLDSIAPLRKLGLTLVIVEHAVEALLKVTDRVIALQEGRIAFAMPSFVLQENRSRWEELLGLGKAFQLRERDCDY